MAPTSKGKRAAETREKFAGVCALLVALALARRFLDNTVFDALFPSELVAPDEGHAHTAAGTLVMDPAEEADHAAGCLDVSPHCAGWAKAGECAKNAVYMSTNCARACMTCGEQAHVTADRVRPAGTEEGALASAAKAAAAEPTVAAQAEGNADAGGDFVCRNEHESCDSWAQAGECDANPQYMRANCAISCDTCEEMRTACDRVGRKAIQSEPGGINALFERVTTAPEFSRYNPQVLSRNPWVVTLDNFLQDEEGAAFVSRCNGSFARSLAGDQLSPVRTSHQCWCSHDGCLYDPHVVALTRRVSELTRIDEANAEFAQVIQYSPGQFYRAHHDQNSAPWTPQGVRLLTVFMYINDVEEGGGTRFTDLGITVQPERGKAVLWPSVLDSDLSSSEPNTHHEALPPVSGVKFGVNLWLHQYDFKTPSRKGCKWTTRNTAP